MPAPARCAMGDIFVPSLSTGTYVASETLY
jgi:hypothetical protein